jgi:hypothetical protein
MPARVIYGGPCVLVDAGVVRECGVDLYSGAPIDASSRTPLREELPGGALRWVESSHVGRVCAQTSFERREVQDDQPWTFELVVIEHDDMGLAVGSR